MDKPSIPEYLMEYIDSLVPSRPLEMQAMEADAEKMDFPIVGPASGYLCYQVARMIAAKRVFELGSGFGYSTAWFARAVAENGGGEVYHVVWAKNYHGRHASPWPRWDMRGSSAIMLERRCKPCARLPVPST